VTAKDHHYTANMGPLDAPRLVCACGHAEPFEDSFGANFSEALERMNAHIRSFYTDEEWEARMQQSKLATLNTATGELKMPPDGPKS
jgi:hypothetical protein